MYTDKEMALTIVSKMPDNATLSEIGHHLTMVDSAQLLASELVEEGIINEQVAGDWVSRFIASRLLLDEGAIQD